jgi:hypothetical protein
VTLVTLLVRDLSGARNFKSFLGTGICFYFRHVNLYYNDTLEVFPTGGPFLNLFGNSSLLSKRSTFFLKRSAKIRVKGFRTRLKQKKNGTFERVSRF